MIKKYSLVFVAFLCFVLAGFGQVVIFSENMGTPASTIAITSHTFQNSPSLTYSGTGDVRNTIVSSGYTGASGSGNVFITNTIGSIGRYFEISGINTIGYTSIALSLGHYKSTTTGNNELLIEVSTDGIAYTSLTYSRATGTGTTNWILITPTGTIPSTNNLRIRFTQTVEGTGTPQFRIDDVKLTGIVSSTNFVDYCNLQFPQNGNVTVGTAHEVFARVYEFGVTDGGGQGANITGWIGYSTTNTDPSTWTNWALANYNLDAGNDDEYKAFIGAALPSGTYYYASRFQISGGPYRYGGYNAGGGGFWNGTTNVSGVLSVDTPDFVNLQFPGLGTIELGDPFAVYGQVYEQGVTPGAGRGAGIQAEVGYRLGGSVTTNPTAAGWTWISAAYNPSCQYNTCNSDQNDEYTANLGGAITVPGTYYYATRFRLNGGAWIYGGILADGSAGNIWNGTTYQNGMLTVNEPPLANVVITEIMYDTQSPPTGDDEWIEICNVSGSNQYLGNYTVRYNGTTRFTFSPATYIADGTCITVSLGSNGDGIFNNQCPFTPTYGIGAGTINTNNLANGSLGYTLSVVATNGSSVIDSVTYSNVDGGNGNGASLHVTNIGLDNSNTSSNWQEVIDGGSPGTNSLISTCTPIAPDIKVRGDLGSFPLIPNGDTTPQGTDNTLFAAQFVGSTGTKSYRVYNQGIINLTISSITLTGANPTDFTISVLPSSTIAPGNYSIMEIEFTPTSAGEKNATVNIASNDTNDNPYTFAIRGNGNCIASSNTVTPTSGPVGTIVTITGTNFAASTSVTINGIPSFKTILNATTMEVTIPSGSVTGNIVVVNSVGCTSNIPFTVINNLISGCEGSTNLTDLIISEITDATAGGLSYVEIYNGTGATRALGGYSIGIYSNGEASPSSSVNLNAINLDNNSTYVVAIGVTSSPDSSNTCPQTGGNGQLANQTSGVSGINKVDNQHDMIRLLKSSGSVVVDAFGVYQDPNWMDATIITGNRGFNFRRLNTASPLPNPTFNIAQWNVIDWVGTGAGSCGTNDYSNIGIFDFSRGNPPTVTVQPIAPISSCDLTATLSVTATEGFTGGFPLAYQWYSNAPGQSGWTALTNSAIYSGTTTGTLTISSIYNVDGYQYYARVMEDGPNCYTASNAVKIRLNVKKWNGSISNNWQTAGNWTPAGMPTNQNVVVIEAATPNSPLLFGAPPIPPTGSNPVYAKTLIISSGAILELQTGQNLIVENCIVNNGTFNLKNSANLVQVNETNQNSGNGNFFMERTVNNIGTNNYIYWSSPIAGFDISGIPGSNTHRYYWSPTAINSNGTQGNWLTAGGSMAKGSGYIVRISGTGNLNATLGGNGLGTPFNGMFTVPISKGSHVYTDLADNVNNYWNLVGNPYPSAISANEFISVNAGELMDDDTDPSILGTIYLWKHQATPNPTLDSPFYENFAINYDGNNYVAFNATGSNPNGEFSGNITSGQSFFIVMDESTTNNTVTFTNTMRYGDDLTDAYNNGEFLRLASPSQNTESTNNIERHRIWLDLIAPNNSSVSTLVGYVTGATNDKDRLFDGYETNSTGLGFYSIVGHDKMGIQGRSVPFDINDTVPLGLNFLQTGTYNIAINQLDGLFQNDQAIFLEDTFTNTIHNLRAAPYSFQSEAGTFNNRFILRYTNSTLSIPEENVGTGLTIIELPNGQVKFMVGNNLTIQSVEIIDMLGRTLYNLKGNNASEIYNLSNLSQAAYVAKVTLSNGQVITKRAVKRF